MSVKIQEIAPILSVQDVRTALAHYSRLGFKATAHDEAAGQPLEYGFIEWGTVSLHVSRFEGMDPKTNASACYLYVSDADALHAVWQSAGVGGRFTLPENTPYGLREFAHIDPDGNLLRIGSPI